jgi:multidrug efflux pump subunit AcrA (membrane-fusion protein)
MSGRGIAAIAVAALAAGTAAGGWAFGYGPFESSARAGAAPEAVPLSTATVTSGTITESTDDAGTLGFASSATVYGQSAGTITWLPYPGAVIRPGGTLFAVDDSATVLMRGQTAAWRAFVPGMTDGPDVTELQRNLVALGYDPAHAITLDGGYDWATQAAVERWQTAHGWYADAVVPLGQIVFLPWPAVRAGSVQSGAGAAVTPGVAVLTVTSTTPVVTVTVPSQGASAVTAGQRVTITLPDATAAPGRITSVTVTASASGGTSTSQQSSTTAQSVTATASIGRPVPASLDGASVQVAIATQTQPNALIVPISALLARPGGGYQVTVVNGGRTHNVTVVPGLFDDLDSEVAITGPGIVPGMRVEVPAP